MIVAVEPLSCTVIVPVPLFFSVSTLYSASRLKIRPKATLRKKLCVPFAAAFASGTMIWTLFNTFGSFSFGSEY